MEPSNELKELYLQSCEAMSSGDHSFFERCFSQRDGVLAIGSDPEEWWEGYAAITRVFKSQLKELGGLRVLADVPKAYGDGSVGWVAGRPVLELPDGTQMPVRLTAVFQKEQEGWKIVQWHFSMGVSNADSIGETPTTR